jgi:hypothetical protein
MRTFTIGIAFSFALSSVASAATVESGRFAAGEKWTAPADHAPAHVSRTFVATATPLAGKATVEVPSTGRSSLLIWVLPASASRSAAALPSTLKTPSGKSVPAQSLKRFELAGEDTGLELPDGQEVLHVSSPEAGSYALELDAKDAAAVTVVAAEPESALTLETWAGPLSRQAGESVTLHAELKDAAGSVGSAHVTARLAGPDGAAGPTVELFDDGRHGDGAAGDGVFAASAKVPRELAGFWSVLFTADGRDAQGSFFSRTGSAGFVSEPGHAQLLPGATATATDAGVHVRANAVVTTPGTYRLEAVASGAADADGSRPAIAWAESTDDLARGRATLELDVPGAPAGAHVEVRLIGLAPMGVAGRAEIDAR